MARLRLQPDRTLGWPLAVGAVAAAALFLTALLDFGDPLRSARDAVELGAAARADQVRATWAELRADAADLVAPRDGFVVEVPDEVPEFARERAPDPRWEATTPIAAALARAARAARARGDSVKAEELAAAAAKRARDRNGVLFAVVQLDRCRWASARDGSGEVRALRAELMRHGAVGARIGGTSVRLLAALVAPVDAALAASVLESDATALPRPVDRIAPSGDGAPRMRLDPWWTTLQNRLRAADRARDWARVFRLDSRRVEAVRHWFGAAIGGTPVGGPQRWEIAQRDGVVFAMRRTARGARVLATTPADLIDRLRSASRASDGPYFVRFEFGGDVPDRVRAREWLDGDWLGFSIHRDDPYRAGRVEASRIAAVRVGLVVLGVAILCAGMLATRALHRTRRLERARSTFVASVTHDLRTPIQSILLMSETLERGRVVREANRTRYFATIRQEAERLRRFVEDVLDSARLDRGDGARVERQTIDTEDLFSTLERDLRQRAERDGASVEFVRERLPSQLELDPDGTMRIVWNLVENALRYGRIDGQPARVRVEVGMRADTLSIVVQDHGPGVPARYAATVFDPFERAGADDDGPTGTGLGLSIVRALAEAHGGDVRLLPSASGARFEARLSTGDQGA